MVDRVGEAAMSGLRNGVVIVGGGIAGSALSIALARRGVAVSLIEREADWTPASSGIFIYTNGLQVLDRLGVLPEICEAGWVSPDGDNLYLTAEGRPITRTTYPRAGAHVPPIVGIRRVDMHRVLSARLARLGVDVRLGVTAGDVDVGSPAEPARITLSSGETIAADLVVGADGIRSQMRSLLFGEIEPTYTGFGVWRSMHAKPASIDTKIMMMGVGTRLGIMPISRDQLYIFGTTREPGKPFYPRESWAVLMKDKFAAFKGPAAALLEEVSDATSVYYTAVEEVHLPPPWSKGRVVVIGDAAHSAAPFMGQGGAMALEDAVVLAEMLDADVDVPRLLLSFAARRFERCKHVQDVSRQVGEAGATEDRRASILRDERMRKSAQGDVDRFYSRILQPI